MEVTVKDRDKLLDKVRILAGQLEAGEDDAAAQLLDDLTHMRQWELFQDMGRITRQLHEALNNVRLDASLNRLTQDELPDAKARLAYVLERTEEAAHRTLSAVESAMPLSTRVGDRARALGGEWARFTRREMESEDFRQLSRELSEFFTELDSGAAAINGSLHEVLMAQEFQDLTGQVLRKVTMLVHELEDHLVSLIRVRGSARAADDPTPKRRPGGTGPQIRPDTSGEFANGQDDVDDLLSSLGF